MSLASKKVCGLVVFSGWSKQFHIHLSLQNLFLNLAFWFLQLFYYLSLKCSQELKPNAAFIQIIFLSLSYLLEIGTNTLFTFKLTLFVNTSFQVFDISSQNRYIVSFSLDICWEANGQCLTIPIMDKNFLPKMQCNFTAGFSIPGKAGILSQYVYQCLSR